MIKDIEQIIADKIASLTGTGGVKLFKTAKRWAFQTAAGAGGPHTFERYSPFAFVKYLSTDTDRAGGLDLVRTLNFAVSIGYHGADARGKVCDLLEEVIEAIDGKHPAELYTGVPEAIPTISCDILLASGVDEVIESETDYAMQIVFEARMINT